MNNAVAAPVGKTADLLAHSHLAVALSAFLLTLQTGWYEGHLHPLSPVALFAFASTLAAYNMPFLSLTSRGLRLRKERRETGRLFLFLAAFAGSFLLISVMPSYIAWPIAAATVLTTGYIMPIRICGKRIRSLRHLPLMKSVTLAAAWTFVTAWVPLLVWPVANQQAGWILAERFFFIFALSISFDIRDEPADRRRGLKTIPVVFGIRTSKAALLASLALFLHCGWQHNLSLMDGLLPFLLTAMVTGALALFGLRAGQTRYSLLMDSTMIIQFVLINWLGS